MIRRGPRSARKAPSSGDRGAQCFWCHRAAPDSPFRSPIADVVGGRYVVCGPKCPERPDDVIVFDAATLQRGLADLDAGRVTDFGADWAKQGEPA